MGLNELFPLRSDPHMGVRGAARELVYTLAHSPDVAVRFAPLRPPPASGLPGREALNESSVAESYIKLNAGIDNIVRGRAPEPSHNSTTANKSN